MRTLIVLPTYQEAANVAAVLRRVRAAVPPAHVLVVDDGSPDGTADLAEAMGEELGGIDVLRRRSKAGLGGAYRAGFAWGLEHDYEVMVEMDADLSHDPSELPSLLRAVAAGSDLAIGSRYVPGGSIPRWPWHRRALSKYGNRYAAALLGLDLADATSGFRAYRADTLKQLAMQQVVADGYGFQIEMAYLVVIGGGTVTEVPIAFTDRTEGTSKMSSRIVIEALLLVTWWGVAQRVRKAAGRPRPDRLVRPWWRSSPRS
ncbi:MAG: dolichol-phosphate mannosyltransferase [Acidimicrobiaceae bacterium]|nr:dolichol-phosphate mannosyltransferase [Acidimicrobiaceae bacterium]